MAPKEKSFSAGNPLAAFLSSSYTTSTIWRRPQSPNSSSSASFVRTEGSPKDRRISPEREQLETRGLDHRNRLDLLYLRYKLDANPTTPTTSSTRSSKNSIIATIRQGKLGSDRGLRHRVRLSQSYPRVNRHLPKCFQHCASHNFLFGAVAASCIPSGQTE